MLFNSLHFMVFLPVVILTYYIVPKRIRYIWLLISSYYFYMSWNPKYALLMLASTAITYASALLMDIIDTKCTEGLKCQRWKKVCVIGNIFINLGILFFYKYYNFASTNIAFLLEQFNLQIRVPAYDIILPVGISFYTFQALGYTIDVYRGQTKAEKNFLRYALFVSFFPQLVAGPIERSKNLLGQLAEERDFEFERARDGVLLMLWGFFLKLVIADRAAIFVDAVYGDYMNYPGWYLAIATMLFAVQIYCDFYGYSVIAMGAAEILGIHLMENFNAPYLSLSVEEFWRKWHISLSSWFKDYVYIPLGGSRKGTVRKQINRMIVFLTSGLWHGADWSFVVWGGLNAIYQIMSDFFLPIRKRFVKVFRLNPDKLAGRLVRMLGTFMLIDFTWVFFRASNVKEAFEVLKYMIPAKNFWVLYTDAIYNCGLDRRNFQLLLLAIGVLLFADVCKYHGIKVRQVLIEQDYWFRWIVIAGSAAFILLFGVWGGSYNASNFIYFQF